MNGRAELDVVIVSYRSRDVLGPCLDALRAHAPARLMRVWVVDNDSRDGTVEFARERYPEVEVIPSERNLGFSAANNLVLRRTDTPYVLALNPDTRVTQGALDALLELMEARPDVGICGPRLVREDGTLDHAAKRSFPTPLSALGHFTGLGRRRSRGRLAAYRAPEIERGAVDAVNGAFMLIRRRALEEVGLFDEGYWMYMEDLDLCYRFARAGWVTWYEPSATVVHLKGRASGRHGGVRLAYAFHYGMHRFYRKHYARQRALPLNALVYAGIWTRFALVAAMSVSTRLVR
jgi:N-acetylglucosaminyl-diphospho-decaprenol L-rhamnosyltransferase